MDVGTRVDHLLDAGDLKALDAAGPAEVVVGVHTLNHSRHILKLLDDIVAGLGKHLQSRHTAVFVADGGSQDGTADLTRAWSAAGGAPPWRRFLDSRPPYSRGRALMALLAAGHHVGAQAVGLVDGDLLAFPQEWVEPLLEPIVEGRVDFVLPAYSRAVSEGTLTTNLLAPVTRALYGRRIQQVLGGVSGLSMGIVEQCLGDTAEMDDISAYGAELWLTTEVLASGARLLEAHLGRKPADPGPAARDLATTVAQTVGPVFDLMERHQAVWPDVRGSVAVERTGDPSVLVADVGGIDVARMVRGFRLGLKDLLPLWEQIMPEATLRELYPLGLLAPEDFVFAPSLWARVVWDFALAYHERRLARDHLLRTLTPLYLGRVAAFLLEAQALPAGRVGELADTIGQSFETEKPGLVARWR